MYLNECRNKLIAPAFGKGAYKAILEEATYYHDLEKLYANFVSCIEYSSERFEEFILCSNQQNEEFQAIESKR